MTDSGYDVHAMVLPRRASGYSPSEQGVINADYVDMTISQGAGGLYSTTHDLLKWERGLFGGRLLNPASLRTLTTVVRGDYALGLQVHDRDGHTVVSHSGGIDGFNTFLAHDPGSRMTVVVLGNLNGPAPTRIGQDLMTLANGGSVVLQGERRSVALAAQALADYTGVYDLAPDFALTISVVDGALTAQATGQRPLALEAEGSDAFFIADLDARIVFTRDASGVVRSLVLHQHGQQIPAPKR